MDNVKLDKVPGGVWTCMLDRPAKLNALSGAMIEELRIVFEEAAEAARVFECRALLVVSSSPKAFCVGADLSERRTMNETQVLETLDALRAMTSALECVPVPTLAVVEGAAFGGGLELALCCDMRVATPSALMGLTETRLAIIPGAGGTQRLSRLLGIARAKEMIFSGKKIDGDHAAAMGLVNACEANARAWASHVAAEICAGGPVAILAAKEAINGGSGLSLEKALDQERRSYERTLRTQDRIEGLKAFDEKRKPQYQGR